MKPSSSGSSLTTSTTSSSTPSGSESDLYGLAMMQDIEEVAAAKTRLRMELVSEFVFYFGVDV